MFVFFIASLVLKEARKFSKLEVRYRNSYDAPLYANITQLIEYLVANENVAGLNPVIRTICTGG